jgi:hypothetical protein
MMLLDITLLNVATVTCHSSSAALAENEPLDGSMQPAYNDQIPFTTK